MRPLVLCGLGMLVLTGLSADLVAGAEGVSPPAAVEVPEFPVARVGAPLFDDPVWHGAADPSVIWHPERKEWWIYYTQRRAALENPKGVDWCHGSAIGIATSKDGIEWKYDGICTGDAGLGTPMEGGFSWWAPCVIHEGGQFHLFVSWVDGIYTDWTGKRFIKHFTSADGRRWQYRMTLPLSSDRCIDACVHRVGDRWMLWYKDEAHGSKTHAVSSADFKEWKLEGAVVADVGHEAPLVWRWKGAYWMMVDAWANGLRIYRSADGVGGWQHHGTVLQEPGVREKDGVQGGHPFVLVQGDKAVVFYHVHHARGRETVLQCAELEMGADGRIVCDRDKHRVAAAAGGGGPRLAESLKDLNGKVRLLFDEPLRDPSVCVGPDGTYYLTGTSEPFWGFNNEKGIRVWKSRDMVAWEPLGTVWRYGESPWHKRYLEARKPLWAPEIHYKKGTFWLTYSMPGWQVGDHFEHCGSGLLRSTTGKAEGPYVDVWPDEPLGDEIDASLFEDDDGTLYFVWHCGKIRKLKRDLSGPDGPARKLVLEVADPDPGHHGGLCAMVHGRGSFDHIGYEGAFLMKQGDRYVLSGSDTYEGKYTCWIATSKTLEGPYSARYPAIPDGGHNMFFKDNQGGWWSTMFNGPVSERPCVLPVDIRPDGQVSLREVRGGGVRTDGGEDGTDGAADGRWPAARAWDWYKGQPWPCGFNYVPANAISYTEMWMDYGFDSARIERELGLAKELGFNCLRVVLPFVVWEREPEEFKRRMEEFLVVCERQGLKVMFALFDDCVFGPVTDPVFGRQPEVVPGWYANGWTPSPGHGMVRDASTWPRLENYVTDVVRTFAKDDRVWVWDVYNEPSNSGLGEATLPLLEKVFGWARATQPSQPLTGGVWNDDARLNAILLGHSDIVTFHSYMPPAVLDSRIKSLAAAGRPVICTEWLNRGRGSTVSGCLPVFVRNGVGCMHWGLVNGRTQTHLNWGHRPGQADPAVWQHDLFRPDLTPYDLREVEQFKRATGKLPALKVWVPHAGLERVLWRYTFRKPEDGWQLSGFTADGWSEGPGGFGTRQTPGSTVGTEWKGEDIWLRRGFELPAGGVSAPALWIHHDEDTEVYLNGVLAAKVTGFNTGGELVDFLPEGKAALKPGKNVMAVHCHQTWGGQYIDVGIVGEDAGGK